MITKFISRDYAGRLIRINPITQYVCVTELCIANGKKFQNWYRQKDTSDFLETLAVETRISVSSLLIVGKGKTKSWAHPQVAIDVAHWCSVKARVWMTKVIFELLTTGKVELSPTSAPAGVIAIDDSKRMHNAGQSVASRDYQPEVKKSKRSVPDGWLTVGEWLQLIMGDRKAAKDAGFIFWLSRQISDLYRSNTGMEPPTVPSKRGSTFCYPPEYQKLIASHYHSWCETHAEQLAAVYLRLAAIPKQTSIFDLPEAT